MDIDEELQLLLNNFWISKEKNREEYYKIKRKIKPIREFVISKLGSNLIVNSNVIKLEKIPTIPDASFKIENFFTKEDYILFMCLLIYLEDKGKEEQFILSDFIQSISNLQVTMNLETNIDFKEHKHRRSLINVMHFASDMGMIRIRDGQEERFVEEGNYEALYENTALSHYWIRNFQSDIYSYQDAFDFIRDEEQKYQNATDKHRNVVYKNLLFAPMMLYDEQEPQAALYLKNYRPRIFKDIEEYLQAEFCLYKNMALINFYDTSGKNIFPNYRTNLSDLVLLINRYLIDLEDHKTENDYIKITEYELKEYMKKLYENYEDYFGAKYKTMSIDKILKEILDYMGLFKMVKKEDEYYLFSPIIALLNGEYQEKEEKKEQDFYEELSLELEEEDE